eukprot:GDKI01014261.1.p2 GENE.GDKI01014261.1~~GDKI01014261.1.p2  ORF type:complete len:142 (+),score=54.41 GDKI01014261.1:136-561(+)
MAVCVHVECKKINKQTHKPTDRKNKLPTETRSHTHNTNHQAKHTGEESSGIYAHGASGWLNTHTMGGKQARARTHTMTDTPCDTKRSDLSRQTRQRESNVCEQHACMHGAETDMADKTAKRTMQHTHTHTQNHTQNTYTQE